MEGDGRDVYRLLKIVVIKIIVGAVLAHIGTHSDRMKNEINLSTKELHRLLKYLT